jgi:hypothetical protein
MIIHHCNKVQKFRQIFQFVGLSLYLFIVYHPAGAQQQPPRPLKVTKFQDMSFGSIILGNVGGKVFIYPKGSRSSTGDIVLPPVGSQGNEAVFEVKAAPGTLITFLLGNTTLSNGAHSMNLQLGPSDPVSPFTNTIQPNGITNVHIGGTLTVGNALQNPAGNYSGIFTITFIQE